MFKRLLTVGLTLLLLFQIDGFRQTSADGEIRIMIDNEDVAVMEMQNNALQNLVVNGEQVYFIYNDVYEVLDTYKDSSGATWYKVSCAYNDQGYYGWIKETNVMVLDESYEEYLDSQGFPESYRPDLRRLHEEYPNWIFTGYETGIKWSTMLAKESTLGKNLINGSDTSLRSKMEGAYDSSTGKYIALDGTSWYQANEETIGYYMDPRNFLNERNIFMFLKLSFNENESIELVRQILSNTFMSGVDSVDGISYAQIFYNAGEESGASPIYLATLAKQEQGVSGSSAVTGGEFTYNDNTYSGLYNFYNIGASSGTDNWKKGLIYANGGETGTTLSTTYNRPWTSPAKAILGGAQYIVKSYIAKGQDTMYFQKFNCTSYSTYSHQYMTNVRGAYSQSTTMYKTYYSNDALDTALTFSIPIYTDMPDSTSLPNATVEEDTLERVEVNEEYDIVNDDTVNDDSDVQQDVEQGNAGDDQTSQDDTEESQDDNTNNDDTQSDQNVGGDINSEEIISVSLTDVLQTLNVTVDGSIVHGFELSQTYAELLSQSPYVMVLSNGTEVSSSTLLTTGQTLQITINGTSTQYTIVMKGDLNKDGKVSTADYLMYRKALLGEVTLDEYSTYAAQIGTTSVNTTGYLKLRRYLLGEIELEQ